MHVRRAQEQPAWTRPVVPHRQEVCGKSWVSILINNTHDQHTLRVIFVSNFEIAMMLNRITLPDTFHSCMNESKSADSSAEAGSAQFPTLQS